LDNVEKLISQIKNDPEIMRARLTGLADDVANVLEKHGWGTAKTYLLEKQNRYELKTQATALLKVLDKMEGYPDIKSNRRVARLIFKTLNSIKYSREG